MQKTDIEWADFSSNPIKLRLRESGKLVNACVKCSPGCENCYAEAMTRRWWPKSEGKFPGYSLPLLKMGDIVANDDELRKLLRFKPRGPFKNGERPMVFVGDMNDSGGDWVPNELLDKLFAVAALRPDVIIQILTKRPERMAEYLDRVNVVQRLATEIRALVGRSDLSVDCPGQVEQAIDRYDDCEGILPNVWLGCSVENQEWADKRIPHLLRCPAAVRFLSIEPLLGPVDFSRHLEIRIPDLDSPIETNIHWVIVGGESGPGARPMHPDWARSLRDQCQAAGVAFFFKQWGEYGPGSALISSGERVFRAFTDKQQWVNKGSTWVNGGVCVDMTGRILRRGGDFDNCQYPVAITHRMGKKKAGRLLDGREWNEFPKVTA